MRRVILTITASNCRAGLCRAGESFVVGEVCPPLCHELWHALYPMVYTLLNGGALDCGEERVKYFDARCPDGGRVAVHGELVEDGEEP